MFSLLFTLLMLYNVYTSCNVYAQNINSSNARSANQVLSNYNSFLVDDFEDVGNWTIKYSQFRNSNWDINNGEYQQSNKWIKWIDIKDYPNLSIFPYTIRNNLTSTKTFNESNKILAIRGKWKQLNYNWVAIEPTKIRYAKEISKNRISVLSNNKTGKANYQIWDKYSPNFIWIPTIIETLSIYVWSGNYNFILEAHFQDSNGQNYLIPVTRLNYKGWKNHKIKLPKKLFNSQSRKSIPEHNNVKFIRFLVKSDNKIEKHRYTGYENMVSPLHLYFDHFYAHIEDLEKFFYGYDLQFYNQFWNNEDKNLKQVNNQAKNQANNADINADIN